MLSSEEHGDDDDRPVTSVDPEEPPPPDEEPSIPPDVPEADALEQSQEVPLDEDADAQERGG